MKTLTAAQKKSLHQAALKVRNNSYSPYSGYKVAAAVLTTDNKIFAGVNIENASYGATICAERSAIFSAIIAGAKKIKGALVMTDEKDPWPPCGMCRQVMAEFADGEMPVFVANKKEITIESTLAEMLPYTYIKSHLLK
jgi:cytidine deaminase